jgi:uncharacterized protein
MGKRAIALLGLFLIPLFSFAYTNPGVPTGLINDFAGVLSTEEKANLESKLAAIKTSTGNEVAVVVIKTLGGEQIENFAVKLFADWGIGDEKLDNGALILVAVEDREIRIEVGYGLEHLLTDIISSRIIVETIVPEFKRGNYAQGLSNGVDQISTILGGGSMPEPRPQKIDWVVIIIWIILMIIFIRMLGGGPFVTLGGTSFGGGGGRWGGGFGGFGGGMSGGGGSSGRW